jgi:hypothetical protein
VTTANRSDSSSSKESGAKKLFSKPLTWIVLVGGLILWFNTGGFPKGEYVCDARSGSQESPISVFHVGGGKINVVKYKANSSVPIEKGVSYTHGWFDRHLNLYLGDASYYCQLR